MIEDKTKVIPMMVPESTDPYVFDTTTQEFVKTKCCVDCGATKNLIESGGQFSGGTWYVCSTCDGRGNKFLEWMKSPEFLETLKRIEKKEIER